jgi:hypothetical protein
MGSKVANEKSMFYQDKRFSQGTFDAKNQNSS